MRTSLESNRSVQVGLGPSAKINLPNFKDEKTKEAVTYHSWQWDIATFHCSEWDDQHLLLYIIWSLQVFLGDLLRSLGENATLNDVL